PLGRSSPEFGGDPGAALRLQQIDAVAVAGKKFDPPVWQGFPARFLLWRGNRALVAAEQQDWGIYPRQQRHRVDTLEAIVHRSGDIGWRPVHLAHDPVAQSVS